MSRKKVLTSLIAVLTIVLLVSACAPAATPTAAPAAPAAPTTAPTAVPPAAPTTAPAAASAFAVSPAIKADVDSGKKLVFRLSYVDPSFEFAQDIIKGINDAAKELNVDAKMVGPTPIDTAKQVAELESLVEQGGLDGIGITSIDDGIFVPLIDKYIAAGYPVVTFNVDSPSSKRLAYFGQDNYNSGRANAEQLIKYMGSDLSGKVAILSQDTSFSSLRDRAQGIQDVLAKYPNITVVGVFGGGGSDLDKTYSVIENVYTQHPDLKAFVAVDGTSTPALGRFMQKEALQDKVIAGGFDLSPETLQAIKGGYLKWSQGQFPYKMGYMSVKALFDAAHGKPVSSVDVGAEIVDSTNVDTYIK